MNTQLVKLIRVYPDFKNHFQNTVIRLIDLHTHTIFSDGELIPSELVRRAVIHGYKAIALTDMPITPISNSLSKQDIKQNTLKVNGISAF